MLLGAIFDFALSDIIETSFDFRSQRIHLSLLY